MLEGVWGQGFRRRRHSEGEERVSGHLKCQDHNFSPRSQAPESEFLIPEPSILLTLAEGMMIESLREC